MLTALSIKNYALIDDLKVNFPEGFIIITGETGSGKSIMLDALSLILGKRADMSALRNKEEKCIIEAEFSLQNYEFQPLFQELDIDYDPQTIIRREILPSGKSRAFVNDVPATLEVLSRLGQVLVDIHSQHQTLALSDTSFQFAIIDAMANNKSLLTEYVQLHQLLKKEQKKLEELIEFQKNAKKEYDYNLHQLKELKSATLEEGILEELEESYEETSNIEDIKENVSESLYLLNDENIGILNNLRELKRSFSSLTEYKQLYRDLYERIESAFLELEDLASEISDIDESIEADPDNLEQISKQLNKIYSLQKKHSVATVEELIAIQQELEEAVSKTESVDIDLNKQKKIVEEQHTATLKKANQLHKAREKVIPALDKKLTNFMHELGMPNGRFSITLTATDTFFANGNDELSFLFSANKGGDFGQLKKVASGGELSRIMLTIKHILATKIALPTIIFDEIDTGVSGEIAHKMGEIMKQMSQSRQVFAISHLPQVASKGDVHIKIYKTDIAGRTTTQFQELSPEQRIEEIAQMLGGKDITDSARAHAKELLKI